MHTKVVELKEYTNDKLSLLTEVVLLEATIIFGVISLIASEFLPVFYIVMSLLLFNFAYNNYRFFKKKFMTIIYILAGLFVLITTILEFIF